ncbi:Dps family protein [Sabulibacter ruber]|uniref:Dps family protein n=1 Tax=Sabulibacter ruber TaxID=2811901 RepID=UPI001A9717D2|nr:Dps family protein [Sabulibacter ruber]
METQNELGLERQDTKDVALKLNELLANYHLYYQNLRAFHWNIRGGNFFQLHAKFEELYTAAIEKIDEIAERILTLGHTPLHSFSDYLQYSHIKEAKGLTSDQDTVGTTVENIGQIIHLERELLALADERDDEGTQGLISEDLNALEKNLWMLNAFLGK